jgi:hypothetical protein
MNVAAVAFLPGLTIAADGWTTMITAQRAYSALRIKQLSLKDWLHMHRITWNTAIVSGVKFPFDIVHQRQFTSKRISECFGLSAAITICKLAPKLTFCKFCRIQAFTAYQRKL